MTAAPPAPEAGGLVQYARDTGFLLRGCRGALLTAFALCGASAALDMACIVLLPLFLYTTMGSAGGGAPLPFSPLPQDWTPAYPGLALAVVATFALRGALSLYVGARLTRLSEAIRAMLTRRLARFYLTCPFQLFTGRTVAWALTMSGTYTGTFAASVALPMLRLLLDVITMVAIFSLLVVIDHRVVGVTAMALAAIGLGYYLAVRRASARQSKRLSELQATFGQHMSRSLHSPREVRVFQLQPHFLAGMDDVLHKAADAQAKLTVIGSLPRVLGELTLIGLALGYLVYRTRMGTDAALMMSQLGMLAFAGLRLLSSFSLMLGNIAALQSGRHVTGLLARELRSVPEAPMSTDTPVPAAAEAFASLELRDISFSYGDARPVLQAVSLQIARGESVGVIGASGAGKSTLADLILGLLVPAAGATILNGREQRLDDARWWRMAGFVPQAVFLTNDTLLRNVAFGVADAAIDRTRVEDAIALAQLDEFVRQAPRGLDTTIGDYGVRLSGGQRQRVAIARALYHQRQFLVLDEATSALDTETERAVVQAVASLRGRVTTFIIAHRRSTLDGCDRVFEVRGGRLHALEPGSTRSSTG